MGAPGPVVAGGMLFLGSGYTGSATGAGGNVLLAFEAEEARSSGRKHEGIRGHEGHEACDDDEPQGTETQRCLIFPTWWRWRRSGRPQTL